MDIIRGSLEEISRPASSARVHLGTPGSSTSLEVLTPEPSLPKAIATVESPPADRRLSPESRRAEGSGGSDQGEREQCSRLSGPHQGCSEDGTGSDCPRLIQSPLPSDSGSSLGDSEDDCATVASSTPRKPSPEPRIHVAEGTLKVKEADPRLQAAIQKMKSLDKLLVKRLSQEKEIKKQGQEMRIKLWADLRLVTYPGDLGRNEEIENTRKFWALTASSEEAAAAAPSRCEEDGAVFHSVFHTQLPPGDYENRGGGGAGLDPESEREAGESSDKAGEKPSSRGESELRANTCQDFIKRNIELAKDAGGQLVMMDEEKKRLVELLKASEDEGGDFPATEGDPTPGVVPGDKALQRNKEERDQRNRLREIDRQLRALKGDPVEGLPGPSEERLRLPLGRGRLAPGPASDLVPPSPTDQPLLPSGLDGPATVGSVAPGPPGLAEEVEVAAPGDADNNDDVFTVSTPRGAGGLENPSFPEEEGCQASWTNDPDLSAGAPRPGVPRTPRTGGVLSPRESLAPKRHTRKEEKENVRESVAGFPTPSSPRAPLGMYLFSCPSCDLF
ncbi:fibrous sheath-interacting protein 1 isoform X5 [Ornithorhynchus anatinus]|uniref:fibrous sheath-interacting protein 1 isoform X5 n=1 Tax=Ornithorhynchus anatinus TaxID=9258 RepID=UPI0019D46845|nr:fibrous sheath-interacting protein 1 isoform X5 [Ornithorhynchus anatinus]